MSTAVSSTLQTRKTDDDDEDEEDKMAFFWLQVRYITNGLSIK
jgi:hypothetical protein